MDRSERLSEWIKEKYNGNSKLFATDMGISMESINLLLTPGTGIDSDTLTRMGELGLDLNYYLIGKHLEERLVQKLTADLETLRSINMFFSSKIIKMERLIGYIKEECFKSGFELDSQKLYSIYQYGTESNNVL